MSDHDDFEVTFNDKYLEADEKDTLTSEIEDIERILFPNRFSVRSNTISFSLYDDEAQMLVAGTGVFEVMYQPYGVGVNSYRHSRLVNFLDNIDGSYFLASHSKINPLFCSGTFNNISFEIPTSRIDLNNIIGFLYYKAQAILGMYGDILLFKFTPTYDNMSIYVDTNVLSQVNPFIDEDEWMEDIIEHHNETGVPFVDENDTEVPIDELEPWWNRDDGTTRDYSYGDSNSEEPISTIAMDIPEKMDEDEELKLFPLYTSQLNDDGTIDEYPYMDNDTEEKDDDFIMGDGEK